MALQRWDLSARDIHALLRWGLPEAKPVNPNGEQPTADFQDSPDPSLRLPGAPALTGYRLASSNRRWYVAAAGTGTVFAVTRADAEAEGMVNTSVAAFIETVWRWTGLSEVLDPLEAMGEDETVYWCLERFAAWCVQRDPAAKVHSDRGVSWWEELTFS